MLPSHNSWRTAKVNGPALNLLFISSIVGPSLLGTCKSLAAKAKNWNALNGVRPTRSSRPFGGGHRGPAAPAQEGKADEGQRGDDEHSGDRTQDENREGAAGEDERLAQRLLHHRSDHNGQDQRGALVVEHLQAVADAN